MGHSWATESAPCRVPLGSREGLNSFFAREREETGDLRSEGRKEGRKMIPAAARRVDQLSTEQGVQGDPSG